MMREHAVRNGEIIREEDACLKVTSREVQFGFSTYEALRVVKAHPVHLEDHLLRLENSCEGIHLVHGFTETQLKKWVYDLIEVDALQEASVRILIVGGDQPLCFITASPLLSYPDTFYTHGVGAITYIGERLMPSCKTGNLLLNYMALEASRAMGGFEALLVNREKEVLEGTRSNFFAFRDGRLYTAPNEKVLLGVTRDRILKAAGRLEYEIVYVAPLVQDLEAGCYDELFISSTSMGAMPLKRLDGRAYPGPYQRTASICALIRAWELDD